MKLPSFEAVVGKMAASNEITAGDLIMSSTVAMGRSFKALGKGMIRAANIPVKKVSSAFKKSQRSGWTGRVLNLQDWGVKSVKKAVKMDDTHKATRQFELALSYLYFAVSPGKNSGAKLSLALINAGQGDTVLATALKTLKKL